MKFLAESAVILGYRRDATRVMYDILSLVREKVSKTQMVYKANLNFHIVKGYIQYLVGKTFIRKSDSEQAFALYELTERGEHLLEVLETLYSASLLAYPRNSSEMIGRHRERNDT